MKVAFSTLAFWASTSFAARFMLHVPTTQLVNPSTLSSSTHATLQSSGELIDARLTRSNSFNFNNVSAGSYLATIYCRDFMFEPLRIDVSVEEAVEGNKKGEARGEGGNGLVVEAKPMVPKQFYQERSGFSPLSFLKNPMILMALFSMVLIFGIPKLMENMDPEMKAKYEEMQKSGNRLLSGGSSGSNPAAAI
ncbi:hypothetical protein CC80DRAFT_529688 [Byssothecium circinans]|uniref:ER membrane protein complex subunit 7 beta-sandwich domain-containing protein n=1 Tax=Byssothecium circinans TaxID=147558 RepID=A0A6A5T9V4_9PLEO|nr:hypothetical protein CC80DRAFT_529688 [Byssothecium circinans]